MFERFSDIAERAIFFDRYEACQFGTPQIDMEHVLLGILRENHTSQSESHLFYYHHRGARPSQKVGGTAEPIDLIHTLFIRLNNRNEIDTMQIWRTSTL